MVVHARHASKHPPDVILCRSFTRLSTTLAVIEGLGTRLGNRRTHGTYSRTQTPNETTWYQAGKLLDIYNRTTMAKAISSTEMVNLELAIQSIEN